MHKHTNAITELNISPPNKFTIMVIQLNINNITKIIFQNVHPLDTCSSIFACGAEITCGCGATIICGCGAVITCGCGAEITCG